MYINEYNPQELHMNYGYNIQELHSYFSEEHDFPRCRTISIIVPFLPSARVVGRPACLNALLFIPPTNPLCSFGRQRKSCLPQLAGRLLNRAGECLPEGPRVRRRAQNPSKGWRMGIGVDVLNGLLFPNLSTPNWEHK